MSEQKTPRCEAHTRCRRNGRNHSFQCELPLGHGNGVEMVSEQARHQADGGRVTWYGVATENPGNTNWRHGFAPGWQMDPLGGKPAPKVDYATAAFDPYN